MCSPTSTPVLMARSPHVGGMLHKVVIRQTGIRIQPIRPFRRRRLLVQRQLSMAFHPIRWNDNTWTVHTRRSLDHVAFVWQRAVHSYCEQDVQHGGGGADPHAIFGPPSQSMETRHYQVLDTMRNQDDGRIGSLENPQSGRGQPRSHAVTFL